MLCFSKFSSDWYEDEDGCEERPLIDIQPESEDSKTMVSVCTYKCTEVGFEILII